MQVWVNPAVRDREQPGGNGFIATTAAAKSAPDGYTPADGAHGEFAVNPALFDNVPYDPEATS